MLSAESNLIGSINKSLNLLSANQNAVKKFCLQLKIVNPQYVKVQ